jgi:hypothetical protein
MKRPPLTLRSLSRAVGGLPQPPTLGRPPAPRFAKPLTAAPLKPSGARPRSPNTAKPVTGVARGSVAGKLGSFGARKPR